MFNTEYILFGHAIAFTTSLSIEECKKRLAQELQTKPKKLGFFQYFEPIVVRLNDNRFLISRSESLVSQGNYFLVLGGYLKSTTDGTLVQASFWLYPPSFLVMLLGLVVFEALAINDIVRHNADVGLLLVPLIFIAFSGLLFWLTFRLNKSLRSNLNSYLQNILASTVN